MLVAGSVLVSTPRLPNAGEPALGATPRRRTRRGLSKRREPMSKLPLRAAALALAIGALPAHAQQPAPPKEPVRDEFFWLGEINKASTVINAEQGLLDRALAPKLAQGIAKVIEAGNQPGAKRPSTVIAFEPLMIEQAGVEVTLIHAGRSSQDMHA